MKKIDSVPEAVPVEFQPTTAPKNRPMAVTIKAQRK